MIILKSEALLEFTESVFNRTGIKVTKVGKRHPSASLGNDNFCEKYASDKEKNWSEEIERLPEFVKSQPQAAYATFIQGELHKYTYFMPT